MTVMIVVVMIVMIVMVVYDRVDECGDACGDRCVLWKGSLNLIELLNIIIGSLNI